MLRLPRPLLPMLLALAACSEDGPPPWNKAPVIGDLKAFSATVTPRGPPALLFGDRLGPGSSPWADTVAPQNAPYRSAKKATATLTSAGDGPELLVGSLAILLESGTPPAATIARDLSTGVEKWRLAGGVPGFFPGQLTTDGTTVCGVAVNASYVSSELQCVELATGTLKWRKTVPYWLSQGLGYGLMAELVIKGTNLFVQGGGHVTVRALADGAETWTLTARQHARGLVFDGADLLVEGVTDGCATGSACLRAVNPLTGATVAEYAAESASPLWSAGGKTVFLTPTGGATRSTVVYDSSTHTFTEDATLAATFSKAALLTSETLLGVTPVLATGKVYLVALDGTGQNPPTSLGMHTLCRYGVAAKTMDWCQLLRPSAISLRIHPNITFANAYNNGVAQYVPEPGETMVVNEYRFYFGAWGFMRGDVYGYR